MSDNQQNNDTNMILSSKLLSSMIQQIKDSLTRLSELIAKTSETVIIISGHQKDHDNILNELRKDVSKLESRLTELVKDQSLFIINEIKLNSEQHNTILKKVEDIDNRSEKILNEKIKVIIHEIEGNSDEHEEIINKVTELDRNTIDFIKDKNYNIIKEIKISSKKLEEITNRIDSILDKLSIFNNNFFKIFAFVLIFVTIIGLVSGIMGIISFF